MSCRASSIGFTGLCCAQYTCSSGAAGALSSLPGQAEVTGKLQKWKYTGKERVRLCTAGRDLPDVCGSRLLGAQTPAVQMWGCSFAPGGRQQFPVDFRGRVISSENQDVCLLRVMGFIYFFVLIISRIALHIEWVIFQSYSYSHSIFIGIITFYFFVG